jgi:hypothetical protein
MARLAMTKKTQFTQVNEYFLGEHNAASELYKQTPKKQKADDRSPAFR